MLGKYERRTENKGNIFTFINFLFLMISNVVISKNGLLTLSRLLIYLSDIHHDEESKSRCQGKYNRNFIKT